MSHFSFESEMEQEFTGDLPRRCPGCGVRLVRRPKERPHEFERRRSCLRPECSRIARALGGKGWPQRRRSPDLRPPRPTGKFPADVWYGPDIKERGK
jgi:hypothetical protein